MAISIREILTGAIPLGIANATIVLMPMMDTIMLARHGIPDLVSGGLSMQIYSLLFIMGEGIVLGFAPIYGRYLEAKETTNAEATKRAALILITLYSVIVATILFFGSELMAVLEQPTVRAEHAKHYMALLGLSCLPNLLFIYHWEILAFEGDGRHIVIAAAFQLASNVALNFIFIYGNSFLPALGVTGAGIGTCISSWLGSALIYAYANRKFQNHPNNELRNRASPHQCLLKAGEIIKIGVPIGLTIISTVGFLSVSAFTMSQYPEEALAAHLAILQLNEVVVVFALGFSEYCAIQVSAKVRFQTKTQMIEFFKKTVGTAIFFICFLLAAMYIFRDFIFEIFFSSLSNENLTIVRHMERFLRLSILFLIIHTYALTISGILRGCEIVRLPLLVNIFGLWGVGYVSQNVLLSLNPGQPEGIWHGMQYGFTAAAVGASLLLLKALTRPKYPLDFHSS